MGVPVEVARGAIRFSLGRTTTRTEIHGAIKLLVHLLPGEANASISPTKKPVT
jgi:cysteine sulfinate desulfinase/cysteine desulfurase-like protein